MQLQLLCMASPVMVYKASSIPKHLAIGQTERYGKYSLIPCAVYRKDQLSQWPVKYTFYMIIVCIAIATSYNIAITYTINNKSLEWLKFGKSGSQTFCWIKVWQIHHEVNETSCGLIVSQLANESLANFVNSPNFSHSKLLLFMVIIMLVKKYICDRVWENRPCMHKNWNLFYWLTL